MKSELRASLIIGTHNINTLKQKLESYYKFTRRHNKEQNIHFNDCKNLKFQAFEAFIVTKRPNFHF